MPTVGFECPITHGSAERQRVTFAACLATCAQQELPPCFFPYSVLAGIVHGMQGAFAPHIVRVSEITGCLTRAFFQRTMDTYIWPEDAYWLFRGQLAHLLAESAPHPGAIVEQRRYLPLNGGSVLLTGKPDTLEPLPDGSGFILQDYKTNRRLPDTPRTHNLRQTAIYSHMAMAGGQDHAGAELPPVPVRSIHLCYMDMNTLRVFRVPKRMDQFLDPTRVARWFAAQVAPKALALIAGLQSGTPPAPGDWHEDWECKKCPARDCCRYKSAARSRKRRTKPAQAKKSAGRRRQKTTEESAPPPTKTKRQSRGRKKAAEGGAATPSSN